MRVCGIDSQANRNTHSQAVSYVVYNRFFHPLRLIPGPFLATATPWVQLYHGFRGDRHLWLHHLHQQYGSHVRVAPNFVSVNTVEGLNDIYGHGKRFRKSEFYSAFPAIKGVYNTHSVIDKAAHGRKRRVLSQAFSDTALKGMEDVMLLHIRQFCAVLGEETRLLGNEYRTETGLIVRNLSSWFSFLTYDVMGELCFGKSYDMLIDSAKRRMVHLVDRAAHRHYVVCAQHPWINTLTNDTNDFQCGLWLPLDSWGLDRIFIRKLTMDRWNFIMNSRVEATKRAKERVEAGHSAKRDFFYYLLNAKDPETGQGLAMQELWSEANVLMIAGSDTTSTSLAAALFHLVRNPRAMETLKKEIRASFTDVDEIVSGAQLNEMVYLKACIDEAMRLVPAVPAAAPREVLEGGAEVDGVFIPAGTDCGTPAFSVHRRPDYYREPLAYVPERWIEGASCQTAFGSASWTSTKETVETARRAFCPFSIGPRGCIGKGMALMELRITLARMMYLFDIQLANNDTTGEDEDGQFAMTDHFVVAKTGPNVIIRKRS